MMTVMILCDLKSIKSRRITHQDLNKTTYYGRVCCTDIKLSLNTNNFNVYLQVCMSRC